SAGGAASGSPNRGRAEQRRRRQRQRERLRRRDRRTAAAAVATREVRERAVSLGVGDRRDGFKITAAESRFLHAIRAARDAEGTAATRQRARQEGRLAARSAA